MVNTSHDFLNPHFTDDENKEKGINTWQPYYVPDSLSTLS